MSNTSLPILSDEGYKMLKHEIHERMQKFTPLPGNLCHDCGGEVVKKVTGLFRNTLQYSLPECSKCCRLYFYAKEVTIVGVQEFHDRLNKPFTI